MKIEAVHELPALSPEGIRAYLRAKEWIPTREEVLESLGIDTWWNPSAHCSLGVPRSTGTENYTTRVHNIVNDVAGVEDRSPLDVHYDISVVLCDVLRIWAPGVSHIFGGFNLIHLLRLSKFLSVLCADAKDRACFQDGLSGEDAHNIVDRMHLHRSTAGTICLRCSVSIPTCTERTFFRAIQSALKAYQPTQCALEETTHRSDVLAPLTPLSIQLQWGHASTCQSTNGPTFTFEGK